MEGVEKARGALAKDYQGVKAADTSVDVAGRRIAMRRLPDPNGGPEARNQRVEYNGQEYFVSASDRQWINQRATYTLPSSADGRPITVSSFKTGDYSLDPKTVDFIRGGKINGRVVYYDPRGVIGSYDLGRGAKFNYSLLPFEAKAGTRRVYLAIGGRNAEPVYVRADIANKYFDKAGGLKSEGMSSSVGIRKDGDRGPIERGDLI